MITRPITRPITSPIARAINVPHGIALDFNAIVRALFANGEQGFWYDHNDFSALFQDAADTTPVTAADQPVGLQLDKSKGLVLGANISQANYVTAATFTNTTTTLSSTSLSIGAGSAAGRSVSNLSSVITANAWYKITANVTGLTAGTISAALRDSIDGSGTLLDQSAAISSGVLTVFARTTRAVGSLLFVTSAAANALITDISVRELTGNHRFQTAAASRPMLRNSPRRVDYDAVDDSLLTNFPASLGSECTVVRSVPGVGAQILAAQTIGTSYTDNADNCGLIVINRALTGAETALVTNWANQRAFA